MRDEYFVWLPYSVFIYAKALSKEACSMSIILFKLSKDSLWEEILMIAVFLNELLIHNLSNHSSKNDEILSLLFGD